jgi:Domain of unknown function (DU1801)
MASTAKTAATTTAKTAATTTAKTAAKSTVTTAAKSTVTTAAEYLAALPDERRRALAEVRNLVLANLAPGFEEGIQYGMLAYYVPHALYPKGYHVNPKLPLPCVSLASQKNHMALYLMCLYTGSELLEWFEAEWNKTGKKLDLGKSCLRFKQVDDLALDVVAALLRRVTVEAYVASYEAERDAPRAKAGARAKASASTSAKGGSTEPQPTRRKASARRSSARTRG